MSLVAIHQPNFFPWLGYFDKIYRADVFIFLDHVQYQKTGGTWSNRVKLLVGTEARWVSAPIIRSFSGTRQISEIEFSNHNQWRDKFIGTLQANYRRARFFDVIMPILEPLVRNPEVNLAEYNTTAILSLVKSLRLGDCLFCRSSQLNVDSHATDLLIELTQAVGGMAYLCGGGAGGYQSDSSFALSGIQLIYQQFSQPAYPQGNRSDFLPGLSVIDALMHIGLDGTRELFRPTNSLRSGGQL